MLANNNGGIITRMAKRSLVSNRRKNLIMAVAIMLSTFMLFSIFTVGSTFFKMQREQSLHMKGADFDAYIYGGFTKEQREVCERNPEVGAVGVTGFAAWAEETEWDDTLHTSFIWADETYWNVLGKPAMEGVRGSYPQKENEVMASKEALKDCGLENLGIGDSFTITYTNNLGTYTKEFTISGMWEGYGDTDIFYVSKSFFEQSGFTLEDPGRGFLWIRFKSPLVSRKTQNSLEESLNLEKTQRFLIVSETEKSIQILLGMLGLVLITCLSGYLLIYNILYLSVSGNIRYYGLLQTVGMTGRQIYQLMQRQMVLVGALGMGSGILLGLAVSFFLIPGVVKSLGIREGDISIVFHPAIFLASILVVAFTIYMGSRKPAKMATAVSPVEALGYHVLSTKKNSHRTGKGSLLWRLAKEQLTKDKKKTGIVVLSLAASLSVFLCLVTLIESQGPRTIISNYMDADLVIQNDTMQKEEQSDWKQLLSPDFLKKVENQVKEMHVMYNARIVVPSEPEFADAWMREMCEVWMVGNPDEIYEDYKEHPEKYESCMVGIDQSTFEYLNSTLETPVDEEDFLAGRCCILHRNGLEFDMEKLKGKSVNFYLSGGTETVYQIPIASLTDDNYYNLNGEMTMIVSDTFLKSIVKEPYAYRASIQYEEEYDEEVETEIKNFIKESSYAKDFSWDSKIESMKEVEKMQGNMMGVGIGIALILALIGIMNYVNTVSGNIQNRQVELAAMESIGMTGRQVKTLLVREGMLFAGMSLLLTATVGLGITYVIYQSMNYMGIAFAVPVLPMLGMVLFIVAVCVLIPLIAYGVLTGKKTVVERIRRVE